MTDNVPVNAIETSLRLLEALKDRESVGLTELAAEVDMPKSTVFNHLKTLEQNEYIVNESGSYRIGCRFLELGGKARKHHEVYEAAQPEVDRLAAETGEISALLVEEHGWGVFLYRTEGDRAVHIDSYVGQRIYLHGAALGKAILGSLPRARVEEVVDARGLPALTPETITTRDALFEELERTASRGVAFDDQERLNGLRSIAAPLTDAEDEVIGALSIAGPKSRVQDRRFQEEFPAKVRDAADVIELNLTYS